MIIDKIPKCDKLVILRSLQLNDYILIKCSEKIFLAKGETLLNGVRDPQIFLRSLKRSVLIEPALVAKEKSFKVLEKVTIE